jgi:hypothetical protein
MTADPEPGSARDARTRRPLVLVALAAGVAVMALVVWLLLGRGDDGGARPGRATAAGVSLQRLNDLAAAVPHPVYWAGPEPRSTYEFTQTTDGRIYIRYLPPGTKVGSPRGDFLTVGTYPQPKAFETLEATAKRQGATTIQLDGGGLAFRDENRPTSVYAAYPGSDYQIEVYEPSGDRALRLVREGKLAALVKPASEPASRAELRSLAAELGHPVYWAGPESGSTYELTRTKDGRVYVRYLPRGVRVGDPRADFVTVATYPQPNAVETLRASAAKIRATTIDLPGGGLAYIDTKRPTSAYLAFPDAGVQVEVYTPDPKRTERLVTSREIEPVG